MDGFLSGWFVNAPLLLGALGAAVPFILHLVYRRRAPKVSFSTLRFLRLSAERTARRRRIRDWLLLLLRAAVIFLLAVGLAGPIFRSAAIGGEGEVAAAIVLDNTGSMGAQWQDSSQYARACDEAIRLLQIEERPISAAAVAQLLDQEVATPPATDVTVCQRFSCPSAWQTFWSANVA